MSWLQKLIFGWMYLSKPPWDTGISPPELLSFIDSHPPGRALDIGCGTGTNVITLAQHGWETWGVDFIPHAISIAKQKAAQAGVIVNLGVNDATKLKNIIGPFDLILDIGCYHSLSVTGREDYLRNILRLLAEEGTFLVYVFLRDNADEGRGLLTADIDLLSRSLRLIDRQDGTDRGIRRSAWLSLMCE